MALLLFFKVRGCASEMIDETIVFDEQYFLLKIPSHPLIALIDLFVRAGYLLSAAPIK